MSFICDILGLYIPEKGIIKIIMKMTSHKTSDIIKKSGLKVNYYKEIMHTFLYTKPYKYYTCILYNNKKIVYRYLFSDNNLNRSIHINLTNCNNIFYNEHIVIYDNMFDPDDQCFKCVINFPIYY